MTLSTLSALPTLLDISPPWLMPHISTLRRIVTEQDAPSVAAALEAAAGGASGLPRFVEHSILPADEPYESFIARTRCVPTRDNAHDLFNGLIWLMYPQTKGRLNDLQASELTARGTAGPRGPLRDALTVFDENAALLCAPSPLIDALRARDWRALFVTQRTLWASARLVLFGHALLEKLLNPRKGITAHVWIVDSLDDYSLAASIQPQSFTTKSFLPLPILGIPGWWPANEEPSFYDDTEVFRQPR